MTRAVNATERRSPWSDRPAYDHGYLRRGPVRPQIMVDVVPRSTCICPSPSDRGFQRWVACGCPVHDLTLRVSDE